MDKIKVLIADDHHLFIRGIESTLSEDESLHVIGKATNGKAAYEMAKQLRPDVILLAVNLPVLNGLQALQMIIEEMPDVKVLMLTVNDNDNQLFEALKLGAKGYLLKNLLPNELLTFVHMVNRGEGIISGQMASKIIKMMRYSSNTGDSQPNLADERMDFLTKREKEILMQVMKGLTNREIAEALFISENTVKNHLRNIMEKLHMNNRVQAATYALKAGWLQKV